MAPGLFHFLFHPESLQSLFARAGGSCQRGGRRDLPTGETGSDNLSPSAGAVSFLLLKGAQLGHFQSAEDAALGVSPGNVTMGRVRAGTCAWREVRPALPTARVFVKSAYNQEGKRASI